MDKIKLLSRPIILGITVLFIALLYFFIDARYSTIFPRCPFNLVTGLLCPGCGSQRAISAILHGDFLHALRLNLLLVLSLPLIVYSALVHTLNAFRTIQLRQTIFYSPLFVKLFLAAVILFWVLRNIPVYPFTLLAPA
ncbi:DUF2752 domain-containing protein [Segetibacter sp. 3557_3]|uniref:DUF2752 domain-containing protein n=1 Tax=Segetibacter sp. 3557_3 TaxID=2547429 RepID=UPI00105891CC|nr:DUF2752 domain-containing protein [Segetibacter sp. 3557_3]TDH28763.1 DUF2752 domain-containing protein [Segetibacter sp. 3557_3]